MATTRRGLNATLSYPWEGKRRAYRVRCISITHGMQMIYTESQSRTRRAMYPMKRVPTQFSITAALVGYEEHRAFSNWLSAWAAYAISPDLRVAVPVMTVTVPARNFTRVGVPITGVEWGDHVGSMVWNRQIVFETTAEPWDSKKPRYSRYVDPTNSVGYRENRYFYPAGVQLSGDQVPADGTYVPIIDSASAVNLTDEQQATIDAARAYSENIPDYTASGTEEGT
jgi:hypothetical protein